MARLWDTATGRLLGSPLRHGAPVTRLYFRLGAKVLATGGDDGAVRLWDVATCIPLGKPLLHGGAITALAFSPDGKLLLSAGNDGSARLWDADTFEPSAAALRGHYGPVNAVAFTPDGRLALTAGADGTVRAWLAGSGLADGEPLRHPGPVISLAPGAGGKVLTGCADKAARLWDLTSRLPLGPPLVHEGPVTTVWFGGDPNLAFTGTGGWPRPVGKLFLWDLTTYTLANTPAAQNLNWMTRTPVAVLAFSPGGKTVLTELIQIGSSHSEAQLWDVESGRPIGAPMRGISNKIVAFSPDGRALLTGGGIVLMSELESDSPGARTIQLWEVATGRPLGPPIEHPKPVRTAAFSPDGKIVLAHTGNEDSPGDCHLWEVATGRPLGPRIEHPGGATMAVYSPDGKAVLTAGEDRTVRLWDAATGRNLAEPMKHGSNVTIAVFSPDGKAVLTADSYTARLWRDLPTHPTPSDLPHNSRIKAVAFSPDGKTVVTVCDDHAARLWSVHSGSPLGKPMPHDEEITSASFSPDGQSILTVGEYDAVRLWDASTGRPLGPPLSHGDQVCSAAFSPDCLSVIMISGAESYPGSLPRRWSLSRWKVPRGLPPGLNLSLSMRDNLRESEAVAFSPDGKVVLTSSRDEGAMLWDATTGVSIGAAMHHPSNIVNVAYRPDGKALLTGDRDGAVRTWDAATGRPLTGPFGNMRPPGAFDFPTEPRGVAYRPDGRVILTWSAERASLWDAATGRRLGETPRGQGGIAAAFSPDGQRFALAVRDATVRLCDGATAAPDAHRMPHPTNVRALVFSPDGRMLLTADYSGTARLWDVATGRPLVGPMAHGGMIRAIAYSPNGKSVLTAGEDRAARLWDAVTGRPFGEAMMNRGKVTAAAFSPDSRLILTGDDIGMVYLWDAATTSPIGPPIVASGEHASVVPMLAFSPDGRRFVVGHITDSARIMVIPDGVEGDPERVSRWARVVACGEIDPSGVFRRLDCESWVDLRHKLEVAGGPLPDPYDTPAYEQLQRRWIIQESLSWGHLFSAFWHADRLMAERPHASDTCILHAWAQAELGHHEAALADYTHAIDLGARSWDVWTGRASVYEQLKRWDDAAADYARAIDLNPDSDALRHRRARSYCKLGKWEQALADYAFVLRRRPNSSSTWEEGGDALAKLGRWRQAVSAYTRAIEINAKIRLISTVLWAKRGHALIKAGRWQEAIPDYDKAVEKNPGNKGYRIDRGRLRATAGDWQGAAADLEAAAVLQTAPASSADDFYRAACARSLLSGLAGRPSSGLSVIEGKAQADEAMQLLRRAHEAGFQVFAHIQSDPDLDPLRSHADLRLFMMDLAMPVDPFSDPR